MELPAAVVVAGQVFGVVVESRKELDGVHGRTSGIRQTIRLADDLGPDLRRETLLHEVLHAVRWLSDLRNREHETRVMGVTLLDTLRRNPALVAYLMETSDGTV